MKTLFVFFAVVLCTYYTNAQWTQCPLYGGHIFSIATSDSILFTGAGVSMYKSTNYASFWNSSSVGLPATYIRSIAIRGNEIYAGINLNGMYKSHDNGASWDSIKTGLPAYCTPISILFNNNDIFISIADGYGVGVYKSSDGGNSWNSSSNGMSDSVIFCMIKDSTGIYAGSLAVGTLGSIYKTTDNGVTWFPSKNGVASGFRACGMAIKDDILYAAGLTPGSGFQVYSSSNNGTNWLLCSGINNTILCLVASGSYLYMGTDNGILRSSDGLVWAVVNSGLRSKVITALKSNSTDVFAGTLDGLYKLSNGDTVWVPAYNGITSFEITSMSNIGNNLLAGERASGIYSTSDHGSTWEARNNGLSDMHILSMCSDGNNIYAGGYGCVHKTMDMGNNWQSSYSGVPFLEINDIVARDPFVWIGTYNGIFRSQDGGSNFNISNSGLLSTDVKVLEMNSINELFAGVHDMGIYKSTNNGASWTYMSSYAGLSYVNALAANDDYLIAGLEFYNPPVIATNDYGLTWQVGNNGLYGHTVRSLKSIGNCVFAGLNDGVFYTKNYGLDWYDMSFGLPVANVVCFGRDDSCVYAGVAGHGVWKRPLSDFAIDFTENSVTELSSNHTIFPNPATNLLYINCEENATVEIINMQGQIVATKMLSGKNESVDVSGFPKGVYVVKVKTELGVITKKIIKE